MKVVETDCDPTLAQDRSLPNNSFLVEYIQDEVTHFDLVISSKQVDIFDHYYDKYKLRVELIQDFGIQNQIRKKNE